ncbi:MAG: hypothetical protein AAF756_17895 [Pseudomonadota bacterium]
MRVTISSACLLLMAATELQASECAPLFEPSYDGDDTYLFGGGTTDGLAQAAQSLLAVNANTVKSNAVVKYTSATSAAENLPPEDNFDWIDGCNHSLSLSLTAPLDTSDEVTELANLDGLADAYTLTVSYSRYVDRVRRNPNPAPGTLLENWSYFWGGEARIGRENFKFIEADSISETEEDETPWSVAVFGGHELGRWTVTYRAKFEQQYKPQNDVVRCPSSAVEVEFIDCISGANGGPNDVDSRQVSIEMRRVIERFTFIGPIGIAPAIHHDLEQHVTGVDVPVFLWQSDKGQLTGGVRFGWRDDTNDSQFGVFVSQPF